MKTTKLLFTAILVFTITVNTFSQEYHPFLNHSSWIIYEWVSCCQSFPDKTIEEGTDTIIGSTTYKKFIDPYAVDGITEVYLREDVSEKKVYKLVSGTEVLLYDFSLETGNTILYAGDTFTATVDNIAVNGGTRKRIKLVSTQLHCGQQLTQYWIEGVGGDEHPFYPGYDMLGHVCAAGGGLDYITKCSFQNGVHVYGPSDCALPQPYHPLLNNSSWVIYDWVSCCQPPTEKIIPESTDEVIGGVTYKKFIDPFAVNGNTADYLREDADDERVYKLVNGTEVLLYDFSLETGSTILYAGNTFTAQVDNIAVNGGTRKRITLTSEEFYCGQNLTMVWIEGVGTDRHPFYPDFNIMIVCSSGGGYNISTKCSFQNGIQVFGPADCSLPLSVQDYPYYRSITTSPGENIQLFPNPATDIVQVRLQNSIETLDSITVYDLTGKMIEKVSGIAANQSSLSVGSLAKGMYLVEITTQSKMKTTKKLIVN